jgi:hypothetical protein
MCQRDADARSQAPRRQLVAAIRQHPRRHRRRTASDGTATRFTSLEGVAALRPMDIDCNVMVFMTVRTYPDSSAAAGCSANADSLLTAVVTTFCYTLSALSARMPCPWPLPPRFRLVGKKRDRLQFLTTAM